MYVCVFRIKHRAPVFPSLKPLTFKYSSCVACILRIVIQIADACCTTCLSKERFWWSLLNQLLLVTPTRPKYGKKITTLRYFTHRLTWLFTAWATSDCTSNWIPGIQKGQVINRPAQCTCWMLREQIKRVVCSPRLGIIWYPGDWAMFVPIFTAILPSIMAMGEQLNLSFTLSITILSLI